MAMTDLHKIKDQARRDARERRKFAASQQVNAAFKACRTFLKHFEIGEGDTVALYRAIQSELDPQPLVEALWKAGIETCFPVVAKADTPLEFRAANAKTLFISGAFGASIPEDGTPIVTPTIIIAPLLSFDRAGYRLGYGGGFYDRTLENLRALAPTRAYGYAYAAQEVDTVPIEPTDQRLDGIVTEGGIISIS